MSKARDLELQRLSPWQKWNGSLVGVDLTQEVITETHVEGGPDHPTTVTVVIHSYRRKWHEDERIETVTNRGTKAVLITRWYPQ